MFYFFRSGNAQTLQSDALTTCMDLFTTQKMQDALVDTIWNSYVSPESLQNPDAEVFSVTTSALVAQYLSLLGGEMVLRLRVVYTNNVSNTILPNAEVGFIAAIGTTMWKRLEVYMNDRVVPFLGNNELGVVGYIGLKNTYSPETLAGPMAAQRITMNTPNNYAAIGAIDEAENQNAAYEASKFMARNGEFEIICKPPGDVFHCERLLPPATRMRFVFTRHTNDYVLTYPKLPDKIIGPNNQEYDGPTGFK